MPVALLSVYDKTGIQEFADVLVAAGWTIWSSGGTAAALKSVGIPVTDVADITGFPAMLDHRVATLHPLIHGGILADPSNTEHRREMAEFGIEPISLVVVNLYPFQAQPSVELIDIGGPTLVRGAAKNSAHVAVVVRPEDYAAVINEIRVNGVIGAPTRRTLAARAFAITASYDMEIAQWLARDEDELPEDLFVRAHKVQTLRYGENPHQRGGRYRIEGRTSWWDGVTQHGGKDLSYLNVFDTQAAWTLVHRFRSPACVIVKHANPCGVAVVGDGDDIALAYDRANDCDPVSAFGGIVAVNRSVTGDMARELSGVFTEVVIAPSFDDEALEILSEKKNLRTLSGPPPHRSDIDIRSIDGGLLVQTPDDVSTDRSSWHVVTEAKPSPESWPDIELAWRVAAAVSSNAIVLVEGGRAVGIGAGQQNRLDSARIAVERANGRAIGGACASDAFFPFRDGVDAVAAAGISVIVQPGGSVRDAEVVSAANELGIAMVFTGERHFRH